MHQFRILARLAAAVGGIEKDDTRFTVLREEASVFHPASLVQPLEALHHRAVEPQGIGPHIAFLDGRTAVKRLLVLPQGLFHVSGNCQERIHAGIVRFLQEIGPVAAEEGEDVQHLAVLRLGRYGDVRAGLVPIELKGVHGIQLPIQVSSPEQYGHTLLSINILQLFPLLRRQEGRYVFLIAEP